MEQPIYPGLERHVRPQRLGGRSAPIAYERAGSSATIQASIARS